MSHRHSLIGLLAGGILAVAAALGSAARGGEGPLQIGGIYPHLTVFNGAFDAKTGEWKGTGPECGIGAVVPWAGKLWLITYPPHMRTGSPDKLWTIDEKLNLEMRPESVGGTHASRMIHRESKQLIIGPYFVDEEGNVRAADVHQLVGRMTAAARHLSDPANMVYFFDMEGPIYEVNVHTLAVTRPFEKPVPGWHGKGGYTGQGRFIIANNGESAALSVGYSKLLVGGKAEGPEDCGALAEWDGKEWRVVERRQYTDVTGPGGIYGAPDDKAPVWAIGWDKRSVLLKLLDGGKWSTFRLPKATHTYDPRHGFFTEWPRIREAAPGKWLMDMHGTFFEFPPEFSKGRTAGIRPLASHLRYIPDFCHWNGRTILAADDASLMGNPMVGRAQSNLWFGQYDELRSWGPRSGWGGPWMNDPVKVGEPSLPYLFAGYEKRVVHLAHDAKQPVKFTLQLDAAGDGNFKTYETIAVPAEGYKYHVFPKGLDAAWVRLSVDRDCTATAYFHYTSPRPENAAESKMFAGLAAVQDTGVRGGLIRPAAHNTSLQFVSMAEAADVASEGDSPIFAAKYVFSDGDLLCAAKIGTVPCERPETYYEVDSKIAFSTPESRAEEVKKIAAIEPHFEVDEASVIMVRDGGRYRLPKGDARFDKPFGLGWPRGIREVQSERNMVNVHGTFYEMPREKGLPSIRPVCSHDKQIIDYCSWHGLLVLSGVRKDAQPDGHTFLSADGKTGLWFGCVDDLWKLGKPRGSGGPWLNAAVKPGERSDPYLMTNYDRKTLELKHDAAEAVTFTLEVDFDHRGWHAYQTLKVEPGQTLRHEFADGFAAHWIRFSADRACRATARLTYE